MTKASLLTTAEIRDLLGYKGTDCARQFVRRARIPAVVDPETGRKRYLQDAVLAARNAMPGKGVGGGRPKHQPSTQPS